jgi:RNA polymerase sigma-70 factor (ECF subfamily)
MQINQLWSKYNQDVKKIIFSKIKNEEITNDLVQETFIKAHIKLESLNDVNKVKSWLLTIARNTTIDYFRKSSKTVPLGNFDIVDEPIEEEEHTPKHCLPGIIKHLPKKYRDPLFLYDIQGIKQADIANKLKLPLATVKSQIQRARKLIAKGYMDCCDYTLNDKGFLVGETKEKEDCKVCK